MKEARKKKLKAGVIVGIVAISVVCAVAGQAAAEAQRGYKAAGGEYFILPLGVGVAWAVHKLWRVKRKVSKVVKLTPEQDWLWVTGQGWERNL